MARLHSPEGTARYCSLFTPRQRKNKQGVLQGDPKFQITLIFDEDTNLKAMKAAAQEAGEEKFGTKFMDMVKKGKANWPFRDNTERENDEGDRIEGFENDDGCFVSFKNKDKPGVVDADAEPIMEKSEVYDGMRCRVSCRAFAYDNESKGVAFALVNVQKLGDGARLSGDPSAEDDFKAVAKGKKPAGKKVNVDDLL